MSLSPQTPDPGPQSQIRGEPAANYEQAVAREEENRLLALHGRARPLLGFSMIALRWRHVLDFTFAGNAFFNAAREPERADVFQFIWCLHPCFSWPDGILPNQLPRQPVPSRFARLRARLACQRLARIAPPLELAPLIHAWIDLAWQDSPAPDTGSGGGGLPACTSSLSPRLRWLDVVAADVTLGPTLRDRLETPVALSFQHMRTRALASGDDDLASRFIPPSAALKTLTD